MNKIISLGPVISDLQVSNLFKPTIRLEINLNALVNNLDIIKNKIGPRCRLMAVVKGNAYGLGDIKIAKFLIKNNVDYLAVARIGEAKRLRAAGISFPNIFLLEVMHTFEAEDVIKNNLIPSIAHRRSAVALEKAATHQNTKVGIHQKKIGIHLKIDTGLNFDGCNMKRALPLVRYIHKNCPHLDIKGIYTHFSEADTDDLYTKKQLGRFNSLLVALKKENICPPIIHAANSAGIMNYPQAHFNCARSGADLYGIQHGLPFQEVASLITYITDIDYIANGMRCGYGHNKNIVSKPSWRATISLGYADGLSRDYNDKHPLSVIVNHKKSLILSPLAMDKTAIDITDSYNPKTKNIKIGDEVLVFGQNGNQYQSIKETAKQQNAIPVEVLSHLLPRVPREYRS